MMEMGSALQSTGRFGAGHARGAVQQRTGHLWEVK